MGKGKTPAEDSSKSKDPEIFLKASKSKKRNATDNSTSSSSDREVLIKVGGFEYKTPTKRTRVLLGALVIGLNLLLVLATALYFYVPAFKDFVYNIGRS